MKIFGKFLAIPQVYNFWQFLIGDFKLRKTYCKDYVKAKEGDRILDIGCGPGNMIPFLPKNIEYIGFDESKQYITSASKKFPETKYSFFCENINFAKSFDKKFDIIMANAILHHLNDEDAQKLIAFASNNLTPEGKFVTLDGCFTNNQNFINNWLLKNDRGKFVRNKDDYYKLFKNHFNNIKIDIKENLYNIPYTIIIFECTNRL